MAASMRVRFELFVQEMGVAVAFYTGAMGFDLLREEPGYASLRRGEAILGLGPISKLPAGGGCFTRHIAEHRRGLGVEIVLEVDDLDAYHARILVSEYEISEPLRERSWGLRDFPGRRPGRLLPAHHVAGVSLPAGPAQVQATTASPGFQPGGSAQSQAAASRCVLESSVRMSMRQAKIRLRPLLTA